MSGSLDGTYSDLVDGGGSSIDLYRLEDYVIGGSHGRRLDPKLVALLLKRLRYGATLKVACRGVGLSWPLVRDLVLLGEELLDRMSMSETELQLSEREGEAVWLAHAVLKETGNRQFLGELVIHEALRGNVPLSRGRFALDVLSRTDPENWDKKNKLPVRGVEHDDDGVVAELTDGETPREKLKREERKREERNEKMRALREESMKQKRTEAPSE